jgi:hypothetical protein
MPPLCDEHLWYLDRYLDFKGEYRPFLDATDIQRSISSGCREYGFKHDRVHHMLSKLERDVFLILDAIRRISCIKEQYPLDPRETWKICCKDNLEHPNLSGKLTVVTIDFFVTLMENGKIVYVGIDIKPSDELQKPDVLRKLEISRRWCVERGFRHWIWTEKEINGTLATNIKEMRDSLKISEFRVNQIQIDAVNSYVTPRLGEENTLSQICLECDNQMGFDKGTSLRIAKYLIVRDIWLYDMTYPFDPSKAATNQYITANHEADHSPTSTT